MSVKQKLTDQQRLEFAKQIEYMFEAAHPGWGKVMWLAFIKGLFTGFGAVLGGTILIAILIWILGGVDTIPFLGDLADNARQTIEQGE